jgi:hypothetical protein
MRVMSGLRREGSSAVLGRNTISALRGGGAFGGGDDERVSFEVEREGGR